MEFICITNNNLVNDKYKDKFEVLFFDIPLRDIMINVRDRVHEGHKILTHPLSGSVKPNETYVKTIFISKEKGNGIDFDSLTIIENSIITCDKFTERKIEYEKYKDDFETVDLALTESALMSLL